MRSISPPAPSPVARFAVFVAAVLTVVMLLFPPFMSIGGVEYAFVLTGPEWANRAGALVTELGLSMVIHWPRLVVQIGAVWAVAFGAWRYLPGPPAG